MQPDAPLDVLVLREGKNKGQSRSLACRLAQQGDQAGPHPPGASYPQAGWTASDGRDATATAGRLLALVLQKN